MALSLRRISGMLGRRPLLPGKGTPPPVVHERSTTAEPADALDLTQPLERLLAIPGARAWIAADKPNQDGECACCGAPASFKIERSPVCVVCASVFSFGKPGLDDRSGIAWLPWFSQGAINRLVGAHLRYASPDESALETALEAGRRHLEEILSAAKAVAARKLGTDKPSVLLEALSDPETLTAFAGSGIRLLPLGVWQRGNGRNAFFDRDPVNEGAAP